MSNCTDCNDSNPISLTGSFFPGSPCVDNTDCTGVSISSACVYYNGPNLSCSGILTLDSIETALQKIDEQICAIIGDYSTYTMNCLPDWWEASITTEAVFVDAITSFACNIYQTVNNFIDVIYAADLSATNAAIAALQVPGITCTSASVISSDTLNQILTKYCTKFGEIDDALDISGVDWNNCFTVVSPPTTIEGGFQLQADQICLLYDMINDGSALPTFNNYVNCLAGTSSDSLVTTIGLITTKLCAAPVFDNDDLTSTCISIPASSTDLTTLIQNIIDAVDASTQNYVTFDASDFDIVATDPMDPCAGITVSLATPATQDRFVAVSAGDASPSTLIAKIASAAGSVAVTNNADTTLNLEIATGDRGDITVSAAGLTWTIDNDVVTFAKMQNIATQTLIGRSTAGTGDPESITVGSGLLLSGGTLSVSAPAVPISSLIAATIANTIDNGNFAQTWQWNTLSGSNALVLSSASTAGASQILFDARLSGALVTGSASTLVAHFENTHTGTNSSNTAVTAYASGGTANYGIVCSGAGGQWGTADGASIYALGRMRIDGQIDTYGSSSGIVTIKPAATAGTWTFTLPTNDGDANQVLITDGTGITSWGNPLSLTSYTPTLFNTTNISASTASVTRAFRSGAFMYVYGVVTIDATAAATPSELGMSLPTSSNLANVYDLAGTGAQADGTAVQITADTTNDRAKFSFTPVTDTNNQYSFQFCYIVI